MGCREAVLDGAASAIQQLNEQESMVVETPAGNAIASGPKKSKRSLMSWLNTLFLSHVISELRSRS